MVLRSIYVSVFWRIVVSKKAQAAKVNIVTTVAADGFSANNYTDIIADIINP